MHTATRRLVLIGLGACGLLRAGDPAPQKVSAANTEHSDFPSGGTLHLKNSIGEVTVEGWDQPGMEITTIKASKIAVEGMERDKATKLLDSVKVTTDRKGVEVTISTEFRKHRKLARPFEGFTDFDLEYRIKVPRSAHLVIDHTQGEVHIEGITGEIHATADMGLISVRAPDGQYAIDAISKLGAVESDFPGNDKSIKWFGHAFLGDTPTAPQKIFLRIRYGDLLVLRMQPQPPAPSAASGK